MTEKECDELKKDIPVLVNYFSFNLCKIKLYLDTHYKWDTPQEFSDGDGEESESVTIEHPVLVSRDENSVNGEDIRQENADHGGSSKKEGPDESLVGCGR